ncbi:MAG: hypothetical protein FJ267_16900, partial [Planctomycetes bacterium]|nr:hypothetical protein [Planctomycetota bacterium]
MTNAPRTNSLIKRTIEVSTQPAHLSVTANQLILRRDGENVGSIPCEDIGVILVDHPQATYSHAALVRLAESQAAVVICGRDHLPCSILLPLADHSQVVWRLREQLDASRPIRKRLWMQLIRAKIVQQSQNIDQDRSAHS